MKKLLLIVLGVSFFGANAQNYKGAPLTDKKEPNAPVPFEKSSIKQNSLKRDVGSFWFSPLELSSVRTPAGGQQSYTSTAQLMYPDSNVIVVPGGSDPTFHWWFHGLGNTCDPLDADWELTQTGNKYSVYNKYSWDSINFTYFYLRKVDSVKVGANMVPVVDTLYVHYFLPNRMTFNSWTNASWTTGQKFGYPTNMDYSRGMPLNAAKIDTILLTVNEKTRDSANTLFPGAITLPVNLNNTLAGTAASRSTIGATVTYQPFIRSKFGDTIAVGEGVPEPFNKINQFRCRVLSNTGAQVSDEGSYSVTLLNTREVRYGQVLSGFIKNYIPASLYSQRRYWDVNFHLTTTNLAVKNSSKEISVMSVYPNPAKENSEVLLSLSADKNASATITLSDISGKVIRTINAELVNGNNDITISTASLSKGMYLVSVTGEGFTSSSKLVID